MKHKFVIAFLSLAWSATPAFSAPIFVHQGKTDPATEGWNYNTYGAAGGTNGPVGPGEAEVASEDAWKFEDPGNNSRPMYESPRLTPTEATSLMANGWELTARVSSPLSSTTAHSRSIEFITPGDPASLVPLDQGKVYRVYITTNATLDQTVTVYNLSGVQSAGTLSPGFHTYRLVATPDASTLFNVSLYIDDAVTPTVTNIPGFTKSTPSMQAFLSPETTSSFVRLGSNASGGPSTLYIAHASLTIGSPAQAGDFDGDGDVDGADFVAWQTNFPKATGATLAEGDADADGDVDGADFVVWQTNFPFTPGPGTSPVPEPSSAALALVAVAVLTNRFCGRRGKWRPNRSAN